MVGALQLGEGSRQQRAVLGAGTSHQFSRMGLHDDAGPSRVPWDYYPSACSRHVFTAPGGPDEPIEVDDNSDDDDEVAPHGSSSYDVSFGGGY